MSSTNQTLTNRTDSRTAEAKPKLDLSPTKIIGGALAAMTAAALGAQLSLVGTVVGAAVASRSRRSPVRCTPRRSSTPATGYEECGGAATLRPRSRRPARADDEPTE